MEKLSAEINDLTACLKFTQKKKRKNHEVKKRNRKFKNRGQRR